MFENLTEDNVIIFAMKLYDKPNIIMSEFDDDMKRFVYLKRLFYRYEKRGDIKERLILNHLVVLYNVFGIEATRLLFFYIEPKHFHILKTFLVFLNYMPERVLGINSKNILSSDISLDSVIVDVLRNLK